MITPTLLTTEDLIFKLLSGIAIKIDKGTFYFSEPGNWFDSDGWPIFEKLHRTDGPAIEYANGAKYWWINGKLHRIDGPAVEYANGAKEWWLNGKFHRTDGPAVESAEGPKEWWLNGKLHRIDGPAIEYLNGSKWWYINGEHYTENKFNEYRRTNC